MVGFVLSPGRGGDLGKRRLSVCASGSGNGVAKVPEPRRAEVHRVTGETEVHVSVNIDGTGVCDSQTGIPFLDHMIHQLSSHGLLDIKVRKFMDLDRWYCRCSAHVQIIEFLLLSD
mmetsp:Transcript_11869/g.49599  ORF Transcript_11869/g.49599 Transcript_11869/m.49599 type:complete len:116 (-) Transcript_11869:851-1198(-)